MYCQLLVLVLFSVQIYCFGHEDTSEVRQRTRYPEIGPLFTADATTRQGRSFPSDARKTKNTKSRNGGFLFKSDYFHESVTSGNKRSPRSAVVGENTVIQTTESFSPVNHSNEETREAETTSEINTKDKLDVDEGLVNMFKEVFLNGKYLHESYATYLTDVRGHLPEGQMERSRRRRGGLLLKRLALPLLLALKMKTALIVPVIFGIVTLIAFKGLWAGLTALGISAALGFKALLSNTNKVLYEVRSPPPHFHHAPLEYSEYWNRRRSEPSSGWR